MIIHNFNTAGMAVCPDKANPPLIIDADAVLTLPVVFQRFQTIAGRYFQKLKSAAAFNCCSLRIATASILANRFTRLP